MTDVVIMVKILVVYESKYGNTKRVAETIIEDLGEARGFEVSLREVKEVDLKVVPQYDVLLIGSPNHMGKPTRGIRDFIDKLNGLQLNGKLFAVFDTYLGGDFKKAMGKMKKQISEKAPKMKRLLPGLSIKVHGMKGPVAEGELLKCREFGNEISVKLKSSGWW